MTDRQVRMIRRRLGLSQPAFAKLVGVHPITVCRWEAGFYRVPEPTARFIRMLTKPARKGRKPVRKRR